MKIYTIERERHSDYYGDRHYRYRSLYNGAVGSWTNREHAEEDGEAHQKIIFALHGIKSIEENDETEAPK